MFACVTADCVEILDWWHAVEKLWLIAQHHFDAESEEAAAWVSGQKAFLMEGRLSAIVRNIRQLYPGGNALPDPVRKATHYLFHNLRRMRYRLFREAGYPIGSGTVESACQLVVQQLLKQSGMRWCRHGAQAMLALRAMLLSQPSQQSLPQLGLARNANILDTPQIFRRLDNRSVS